MEIDVQCYIRTLAGILFITQSTEVAESFNALYRKNVVDKEAQLLDIPETVCQRMREKVRKNDEHDVTVSRNATIVLENTPFLSVVWTQRSFVTHLPPIQSGGYERRF